ncbi:hypothetical protein DESC_770102 [Desulfosarcina cetonica]|nr:hypothetical protein DESC_770102 [Desulfosarcina cetonica]
MAADGPLPVPPCQSPHPKVYPVRFDIVANIDARVKRRGFDEFVKSPRSRLADSEEGGAHHLFETAYSGARHAGV